MIPVLANILLFVVGAAIVTVAILSAIRTLVLPRSARDPLTRAVFLAWRRLFNLRTRYARTYEARDAIMALYAPFALLSLPGVWLALVLFGFMNMYWAAGVRPARAAFLVSGSSLLTLGYAPVSDLPTTILSLTEATVGLILVALLIAYLPSMYTAFQRREAQVAMLEVRAGSPPSAVEMIKRFHRLHTLAALGDQWRRWESWFVDVEEAHTSLPGLVFFRSPQPEHSWVTASGAVLDAAALVASTVDVPRDPQTDLCIRAGYLALRRIADFFDVRYNPAPAPADPISITREEFDAVYEELADYGVPVVADRDQAWRDFAGWRVNYDTPLLALAALTMAPHAPWSSDRSLRPTPSKSPEQPPAW